jgi:hypothetical protein
MDKKLLTQSLVKFFLGVILLGVLIFLPAGSLKALSALKSCGPSFSSTWARVSISK